MTAHLYTTEQMDLSSCNISSGLRFLTSALLVPFASISTYLYLIAASSVLAFYFLRKHKSSYAHLPLPPSPKPLPLIGNLLDIPWDHGWETYNKWFEQLQSDIISFNAAGKSVIVLRTYKAATDLLEKRPNLYSSRVRLPMVNELMGWDFAFSFMPYNDRWRSHRRLFNQAFNVNAARGFEPQEVEAVHRLLLRLIERPGSVMEHLRYTAGSLMLSITYGLDVLPDDDPFIEVAEKAMHTLMAAMIPGAFWVDFLPWLKYVPSWFPGAGFRRKAKEWRELSHAMLEEPFDTAKQQITQGKAGRSFVASHLERMRCEPAFDTEDQEKEVKCVAGAMYGGGSHTTLSTIATFVLAMIKYPELQKKAQDELDRVLKGSLPTFQHQESLPYVTAILKESLRWKPAAPIGGPHCLTSEDVYEGYRLPADSMVIANIWSMLYDEEIYPQPDVFNPERFLKNGKLDPVVRDPALIAFGFGPRICPGRHMAYSSMWIVIASILATMNITKALDEDGNDIEPSGEYESALVYMPKPFECHIKPRSEYAEDSVRAVVSNYESRRF